MVTLAVFAEEMTGKYTYSPIAAAVTAAAAIAVSVILDRRKRKKQEKMRKFLEKHDN